MREFKANSFHGDPARRPPSPPILPSLGSLCLHALMLKISKMGFDFRHSDTVLSEKWGIYNTPPPPLPAWRKACSLPGTGNESVSKKKEDKLGRLQLVLRPGSLEQPDLPTQPPLSSCPPGQGPGCHIPAPTASRASCPRSQSFAGTSSPLLAHPICSSFSSSSMHKGPGPTCPGGEATGHHTCPNTCARCRCTQDNAPGPAREAQATAVQPLQGGRDIPALKPLGRGCPRPSQGLCLLSQWNMPPLG